MKSWTLFFLMPLVFGAPARAENQNIFRLFASGEMLGDRLPSPGDRQQSINQNLGGKVASGMAYTSGTARLTLEPCEDCLRLKACFDLTTSSRTVTKTQPRSDIWVTVYTTATTETNASKVILMHPDHVGTEPAEASSRTALTLHGVSAHATGAFSGEKERQAEIIGRQTAMEGFPEREPEIAEQVRTDAMKNIDEKAGSMIQSFNRDYKEIFYKPVFIDERVPGKLRYHSTSQAIYVNIQTPDSETWESVPPAPDVASDTLVGITVHQSLLNAKGRHELGGKVHDEQTFQDYLQHQGLKEKARDWGAMNEHIVVRFCQSAPIHFEFQPDGLILTLCTESMTVNGERYPGAQLSFHYLLTGPDARRQRKLILHGEPQLTAAAGADSGLAARFQARYGSLFPKELVFADLAMPVLGGEGFTLGRMAFIDGWMTLEWKKKD